MNDLDTAALERHIWRRIWIANLMGAVPINIFFFLHRELFAYRPSLPSPPVMAASMLGIYMVAYVWSRWRAKATFRPIAAWIESGELPDAAMRRRVIGHPLKLTVISLWCWVWAIGCLATGTLLFYEFLGVHYLRMALTTLLSLTIACGLTYLVAEDAMRGLFGHVLREDTEQPRSIGVLPRLTLAWIVGSGSYFTIIVLLAWALRPENLRVQMYLACGFGLVVGAIATYVTARSVARPLDDVHDALARVERGDLGASVVVNDAGEVGHLQAGFNRMAAGLRERDRLHELFGRHVGEDVARRALDAPALAGAERIVSVMFVDVIDSISLSAERPPQAVVGMLNDLFSAVVRVVTAEGGSVNQFQGDGALCIFGAPNDLPDHAHRALRAARALRGEIHELADAYPGFEAAIGVSTGRVVAGDVGTEERYEYTVIGDAANEASRLSDEAKSRPGRLLVSHATIEASGGHTSGWEPSGELVLRGRRSPTAVYELAR